VYSAFAGQDLIGKRWLRRKIICNIKLGIVANVIQPQTQSHKKLTGKTVHSKAN